MRAGRVERAIARLASHGAVLAAERGGAGFGVFARNDRRRRPLVRLSGEEVRQLVASGAIEAAGDGAYALSKAGVARARRDAAAPAERFMAQHVEIVERTIVDADSKVRAVRGLDRNAVVRRLAALRDASGEAWLSAAELDAASRLRSAFEAAEVGLVRGSDWTAPPIGSGARGPGNAQEAAMTRRCDARRRVAEALDRLAPALRRVVERVCLCEDGLETLERSEGWPARSGKLALKLGLAQLAAAG